MGTYLMFGKYSAEALKKISAERTQDSVKLAKKFGGSFKSMYAVLGDYDLYFVADFPDTASAMKASIALHKSTGITFTTYPAISVDEFDKIMG